MRTWGKTALNWSLLGEGFVAVLEPAHLLALVLGTVGGIMVGAIPGLTATMAVALMVPFTFSMDPVTGIVMLLGIYSAAIYGGSITAILMGTPGTPAAAATVLDGYPLAQKGYAGKAIGMATVASFIGGAASAVFLTFFTPQLARVALTFGSPEFFALAVFGMSLVSALAGESMVKGLVSATLGLLISFMGLDPIAGFPRFTFGRMELLNGPSFVPALIGLFAVAECFRGLRGAHLPRPVTGVVRDVWPTLQELARSARTIVRGIFVGLVVGLVPALGAETACWVNYAESKRVSREPEKWGKGHLEGVAAAETANNASTGCDLVPMLTLGVPGDAVTAVMMGALTLHGMQPGPLLFRDHADIVYTIFAGMFLAQVSFFVIGMLGAPLFARVSLVDRKILVPLIFLFSLVGAWAVGGNLFDVWTVLFFGVLGYVLQAYGYPVSPMVIALVLGPMLEQNFRRTLIESHGSLLPFITRPVTAAVLLLTVISLAMVLRRSLRREPTPAVTPADAKAMEGSLR